MKGALVKRCKRAVDAAPTHTELGVMMRHSHETDNMAAFRVMSAYKQRVQWPIVEKALNELGFTFRGYVR